MALLSTVTGLSTAAAATTHHTVKGTLVLTDTDNGAWGPGQSCAGADNGDGYDDIGPGENINVKNGSGKIIGTTELREGVALDSTDCRFRFTVRVPQTGFYQFSLGSRNGTITKTLSQMKRSGWKVAFQLGS